MPAASSTRSRRRPAGPTNGHPARALGATASQALLGKTFRVRQRRGPFLAVAFAPHAPATVHPSSIRRLPAGDDYRRQMARFAGHLQGAASLLNGARPV